MADNLDIVFENFFKERTADLQSRFNTLLRAQVVETNDPLNMYRVRFKCPELHDFNLEPEDCPWALPAESGSKRSGNWQAVAIGDWIWVEFEKGHPYAPVYHVGSAPTRRRMYNLPSIYTQTPNVFEAYDGVQIPIKIKDDSGEAVESTFNGTKAESVGDPPMDWTQEYLPKDNRPMSTGLGDRYGNIDVLNSVGFFPIEHDIEPPQPDIDPLLGGGAQFNQTNGRPVPNDPDSKFMLRLSKYGNMFLISDQGYKWKKEENIGEFLGDFEKDADFEVERWKYIQKLVHEDKPSGRDQRRIQMQTRYGHKVEMRDVGWNKTRDDEYGSPRWIGAGEDYSDPEYKDERWMKIRTKGGHLFQMSDVGFDPEEDNLIKKKLLDEVESPDKEEEFDKDARFIRLLTRSGIKFVLDDIGSNTRKAEEDGMNNDNIGRGILIKGRRTPASKYNDDQGEEQDQWLPSGGWADATKTAKAKSGLPMGYYFQIDERVEFNNLTLGSPLGNTIQISDKEEYIGICSRLPDLPMKCEFLADNEFLEESLFDKSFENKTHHMSIDHFHERMRFKSRAGKGAAPDSANKPGYQFPSGGTQQGIEIHDSPRGKAWTEIVDIENRGLWFSQEYGLGIWRAKTSGKKIYIWLEDKEKSQIVLQNNEGTGKIQIYCKNDVEIKADNNIAMESGKDVTIKAQGTIGFNAGGTSFKFSNKGFGTNGTIRAVEVLAHFPQVRQGKGGPAGTPHPVGVNIPTVTKETKNIVEPSDRA